MKTVAVISALGLLTEIMEPNFYNSGIPYHYLTFYDDTSTVLSAIGKSLQVGKLLHGYLATGEIVK